MDLFRLRHKIFRFLPAPLRLHLQYFRKHKRFLHLNNPITFNEKIFWRKYYQRNPAFVVWADKVAVKNLVAKHIGHEYIIPTLWSGSDISKAPLEALPLPFVVKASNSNDSNVFVRTREELNRVALERDFADISSWHVGMASDEWHYFEIPARILIEPMLQGPNGAIPLDYKFHMFDGGLEAIQVDIGRFVNHRRALYTPEWTKMDVALHYPLAEEDIPRPKLLPRMIEVAEILSADFDYIRIDLYEVDGRFFLGRRPSCQALVMKNSLRYPMTEFGEIVGKLLSPISLAPHYD